MIILSDPMFEEELQEFIAWKTRLGFDIIEAYKGDDGVGNTKESMKALFNPIMIMQQQKNQLLPIY